MTEEPYRWLEAINNRREYIRDQIKGGTPVFALSRPEGVLLLGVGVGQSKVFEIYDRHGFAALGHPVDIEKLRQAAIESAHIEGFNRSSKDVTLRRLISFALSTTLKNAFEQIFSPPLMVECIFAEVGCEPSKDVLARLHFDGNHRYETDGVLIAHSNAKREEEAIQWVKANLKKDHSIRESVGVCLAAWKALMEDQPFIEIKLPEVPKVELGDKTLEIGLLDRRLPDPVHYRTLKLEAFNR